jgi:hypothetical protein
MAILTKVRVAILLFRASQGVSPSGVSPTFPSSLPLG